MLNASTNEEKDRLVEALHCFKCCLDSDVQDFLNTKAIDFEIRGWATTYLLLSRKALSNNELVIDGYFSLTHKALVFNNNVSASFRKKISGIKTSEIDSFVLIGQLGKRIEMKDTGETIASGLTATDLLNDAILIIKQSSELIVNRNIIIECKPIEKVKRIYENYGFSELQYDEQSSQYTLHMKLENTITF